MYGSRGRWTPGVVGSLSVVGRVEIMSVPGAHTVGRRRLSAAGPRLDVSLRARISSGEDSSHGLAFLLLPTTMAFFVCLVRLELAGPSFPAEKTMARGSMPAEEGSPSRTARSIIASAVE